MSGEQASDVVVFTAAQAQTIVNLIERGPLMNLAEAQAVRQLLLDFRAWYQYVTIPRPAPPPQPPQDNDHVAPGCEKFDRPLGPLET